MLVLIGAAFPLEFKRGCILTDRILDLYSLLTAFTHTILDIWELFCVRKNVHSGTNGNPKCECITDTPLPVLITNEFRIL